jgi:hypothetical protein
LPQHQPEGVPARTLAEFLLSGRNADGGWGYYRDKSSRLEPTAWATLALREIAGVTAASVALAQWPSRDGLLLEHAGGEPNYAFHGLALLVMRACQIEHRAGNALLLSGLQRVKGTALAPARHSRQDNSIQGWSWIADTFSWVEPTAWCLLSLKKWAQRPGERVDARRVDDAERLLIDRSCLSGGWNFGNSNMLGQELKAYVPTTAVALLAMQDRRNHPVVGRSLNYLESAATSERSGTALALALVALRACGRRHETVQAVLQQQLSITMELGNHVAIAMAVCALNAERTDAAFTL